VKRASKVINLSTDEGRIDEEDIVEISIADFYGILHCVMFGPKVAFGEEKECNKCEFKKPCDGVVDVYYKYSRRR